MSRSFNINFTWPFLIGMMALIAAGTYLVSTLIGAITGTYELKASLFMSIAALFIGGMGWLFVKVAQANQEAQEEAEN